MPRSKTSPHYAYSQPLLQAMHALTGGKANVKVRNTDAAAKACELMGIQLDAHGKQEQTGQWWTVRWATLAMLDHKAQGLMDFPVKGWWCLTDAGVKSVGTPLVDALAAIDEAEAVLAAFKPAKVDAPAPVVAPTPDPTPAPQVAELLTNIPETVAQVVDSYLLTLQMAATPCFGNWSAKSDSCKGCVLAGRCYEGMLTKLATLAADLPLVEQVKQTIPWSTQATKPAETTVTTTVSGLSAATAALDPSVFGTAVAAKVAAPPLGDAPNAVPTTTKTNFVEMALIADANCVHCKQVIREGELGAYSRKTGFAHVGCVQKLVQGVKP